MVVPWIMSLKKESTSAVAWCLLVIFLPIFGAILFITFGYHSIYRPLKKKKAPSSQISQRGGTAEPFDLAVLKRSTKWVTKDWLASRPISCIQRQPCNAVAFYSRAMPPLRQCLRPSNRPNTTSICSLHLSHRQYSVRTVCVANEESARRHSGSLAHRRSRQSQSLLVALARSS